MVRHFGFALAKKAGYHVQQEGWTDCITYLHTPCGLDASGACYVANQKG